MIFDFFSRSNNVCIGFYQVVCKFVCPLKPRLHKATTNIPSNFSLGSMDGHGSIALYECNSSWSLVCRQLTFTLCAHVGLSLCHVRCRAQLVKEIQYRSGGLWSASASRLISRPRFAHQTPWHRHKGNVNRPTATRLLLRHCVIHVRQSTADATINTSGLFPFNDIILVWFL